MYAIENVLIINGIGRKARKGHNFVGFRIFHSEK